MRESERDRSRANLKDHFMVHGDIYNGVRM